MLGDSSKAAFNYFFKSLAPRLLRSIEKSRSDDSYCSGGVKPAVIGITPLWSAVGTTHLLLTISRTYGTPLKRGIFHRRVETRRYNMDRRYATGFAVNESGLDTRRS